jgi:hypothetical protein
LAGHLVSAFCCWRGILQNAERLVANSGGSKRKGRIPCP